NPMPTRFRLVLICLALPALFWACGNPFAPGLADGTENGGSILTDQGSPAEVLTNFRYAYTFKDSLVYSEILDSAFLFVSTNFNVTPPEAIVWGRDRELRTVGRMFRFFNTLDLTFGSPTAVRVLDTLATGEPRRMEEKLTFTLTLDGGSAIPALIGEVLFEFILRNDGRWYLIRWEDLQS
nr:hypothetical protein [Calditrichia bacterium]